MTKLYLSVTVFLLLAINALPQPVLNQNNMMPTVGTSYTIHEVDPASIDHGDIGANMTWDFSNLTIIGETNYNYVLPSSTPEGSSFTNTNICQYNTTNPSYSYYTYNSSSYTIEGISSSGVVMNYSNPETIFNFPFTFNSISNDDFECNYVSGGIPFNRSGSVTMTAVGYGSIILPFGTYSNVLKLKMEETFQDVYDYGTGPQTIDYTTTNYYWYKPGIPEPLFMLISISMSTGSTSQTASYLDENDLATFIDKEIALQNVKIYPNPAKDIITVNNLHLQSTTNYQIYNIAGNIVKEGEIDQSNNIILSELESGLYIIKFTSNNNNQTLRFVKQ